MAVRQSHLSVDDFNRILDEYYGRNVSHISRSKTTDNITGGETWTESASTDIYCYCMRMEQKWTYDKRAQIEGGDAVLLSKYADGVKKDDIIEMDGVKYIVKNSYNIPGQYNTDNSVTFVYTYCNLFIYKNAN